LPTLPASAALREPSPVAPPDPDPQADSQLDWVGAGASHAWVSVYVPPFGWIELDPTNNVHVGTDHIAVAWGRDFGDVSPLRGVILGGGRHTLSVRVTVEPLHSTTGTSH
jgi:transglutaminase-like putative cysteine protease